MPYEFDHLVIIARDKISKMAKHLENLGFHLTPMAKHNLGSCNQLAMQSNAYVEILGWEEGTIPERKEIADLAMGLDALVFRTTDADQCFKDLQNTGFSVNPVQDLSRPALVNGKIELAQFKTVRFSNQPIPGVRIYFCEHLTPQFLWFDAVLKHPNSTNHLKEITIETHELNTTSDIFSQLLQLTSTHILKNKHEHHLTLLNCKLIIRENASLHLSKISEVSINNQLLSGTHASGNSEIILNHQLCDSV